MVKENEFFAPEIWGGVEYTVNRVRNKYFDQLEFNGHCARESDLELFAELGITKIRYPVLWERVAPNGLKQADWSWVDRRLNRLKELNIEPIVGFVHHGSGPLSTNLLQSSFVSGLAKFAGAFASRYPWVKYFTPVNEPLTTARFSCLYGFWYPHKKDERSFARAFINQCKGVAKSMEGIRKINPEAMLVQSEDLGKTYSTKPLAYQAKFENERRWLSFDLLCGRVNPAHPLYKYLLTIGISPRELWWFVKNPCPPDILGINHYVTSERFLDHSIDNYPKEFIGGNGLQQYADVEAVRVKPDGIAGHYYLLKEAWERFALPLALTEVHLHATREDQLRWIKQAWDAAFRLKKENIPFQGLTAWALLGSYNWNSLVTRNDKHYEPGVFDVRGGTPRITGIGNMIRHLSGNKNYVHPLLEMPGWWRRPQRIIYNKSKNNHTEGNRSPKKTVEGTDINLPSLDFLPMTSAQLKEKSRQVQPLLIVGATGTLGSAFERICEERGIPCKALTRDELNILDINSAILAIEKYNPWGVINAAGYVKVEEAEQNRQEAWMINTYGPMVLAALCRDFDIPFVAFSSDLVFDGKKNKPYLEDDLVNPLNQYGNTKALAEKEILKVNPNALIIRTSSFFGFWDKENWIYKALSKIANDEECRVCDRQTFTATYVPDLVHATLDLFIDQEKGIWHLTNPGAVTWAGIITKAAELLNLDTSLIKSDLQRGKVQKPVYSVLGSKHGILLPHYESALHHFCDHLHLDTVKKYSNLES